MDWVVVVALEEESESIFDKFRRHLVQPMVWYLYKTSTGTAMEALSERFTGFASIRFSVSNAAFTVTSAPPMSSCDTRPRGSRDHFQNARRLDAVSMGHWLAGELTADDVDATC